MIDDILHKKQHNYSFKPIFTGPLSQNPLGCIISDKGGMLLSRSCNQHIVPYNTILTCSYNIVILELCFHTCDPP